MVRVGDAHVGGGSRGDVGDHVVIDVPVVGVQPQIHGDVGVQLLKIRDGLLVDVGLGHVGVVLRPKGDLIVPLNALRLGGHRKGGLLPGAVAGREAQPQGHRQQEREKPFHPLVPPCDTPSMIFFRKARNSRISGTLMTTTAAIMAGMFSRPKPFSLISWMPPLTR